MLIILEGPDGSGKSTLAQNLEYELLKLDPKSHVEHRHAKVPTAHPLNEYLRPLTRYRPLSGRHLILDRWHWGETVYPIVRSRETQLDFESLYAMERYFQRLGAVVVRCTQYAAEYRNVYARRGEAISQLVELSHIDKLFDEIQRISVLDSTTYNWAAPSSANLGRIIAVARDRAEKMAQLNDLVTYSGPRFPYALLLGDVRNGIDLNSEDVRFNMDPAFVPFPSTSGHFLLHNVVNTFTDLGIANACDVDDVPDMYERLGEPYLVALGRNAQRKLTQLGLPHSAVPHPQYVRRFHNSKRFQYANLIEHVIGRNEDHATWPNSSREQPVSEPTSTSSTPSAGTAETRTAATAAS